MRGGLPMINGAHSIIYSSNPEADRAFLRDVLKFPHVDVRDGWLIFALPPAEVAVHPAEENAAASSCSRPGRSSAITSTRVATLEASESNDTRG